MVCKKCGAPLMEDDQFCPECGAKVIRKKKCPECGEPLREGTRFCPSCGAEVGEGRPAKRTESGEMPRKRADSEEEDDWDDEDDDDEESVDILSIMTVAVGCILLVIVAVLGFNLYQRYVPKNYDKVAEEQEKEEEDGEDSGEEQEDGQRLEELPEDSGEETEVTVSAAGTIVTTHDVRIRDNPSTEGTTVITTAKTGDTYEYMEVVEGGHWYKIILPEEYGYEFGYVSADYVEEQ